MSRIRRWPPVSQAPRTTRGPLRTSTRHCGSSTPPARNRPGSTACIRRRRRSWPLSTGNGTAWCGTGTSPTLILTTTQRKEPTDPGGRPQKLLRQQRRMGRPPGRPGLDHHRDRRTQRPRTPAYLTEILTACGTTQGKPLQGQTLERLLPWNRDPAGPGSRDRDPPQLIDPAPTEPVDQRPQLVDGSPHHDTALTTNTGWTSRSINMPFHGIPEALRPGSHGHCYRITGCSLVDSSRGRRPVALGR